MCLMKTCPKNVGAPKNLLVITEQYFFASRKTHIVSYFGQTTCFQHQSQVSCSWSHPEALCQIWCKFAYEWHYNRCKCVFAFNFHNLKNTFINIIFIYFPNRLYGPRPLFLHFSFANSSSLTNMAEARHQECVECTKGPPGGTIAPKGRP